MARKEGQFLVEDFFFLAGGLNTAESPFLVSPSECVGGKNFDYTMKGAIQKRKGHAKLNTVADTELRSLGIGVWDKPSVSREVIRAAGRKFQHFNQTTHALTNLTEDTTTAGDDFGGVSATTPVSFQMYNSATAGILWSVGGGQSGINGIYSSTKVTKNGADTPTGSTSASVTSSSGGGWAAAGSTGTYRYAFSLVKASTGAESNAGVDCSVSVATDSDTVTIDLSNLDSIDTTKYTKLRIYRSSVGGAQGFTAGVLAQDVDISSSVPASVEDKGDILEPAVVVPRPGNAAGDNSTLPNGTYAGLALYKRRLVTTKGSTVYFSDINKPESWPTFQTIDIPSGGAITGLGVITRAFATSDEIQELLCVFKQSEIWVITGDGVLDDNSIPDWSLKYINNAGCPGQSLIVPAEGILAWVNYKGVYLWDGGGKPKCISSTIQDKFQRGGDIDKSKLVIGVGCYVPSRNEIQWYLSTSDEGEQRYCLKLDLELTGAQSSSSDSLGNEKVRGVFTPDVPLFPVYACTAFLESSTATEETVLLGDDAGFLYQGFLTSDEAGEDLTLEYITPYLNLGKPSTPKRIQKVIVWTLDAGPYDLQLDFWSDYRFKDLEKSSQSLPVSASLSAGGAKWGNFKWGEAVWGANADKIKAIWFNLNSINNNLEGDAFRLKFSQTGSSETVVIYGFTIVYSELPLRK